jgi:hypothetical protein
MMKSASNQKMAPSQKKKKKIIAAWATIRVKHLNMKAKFDPHDDVDDDDDCFK